MWMRQILAARKTEPARDTMETLPFDPPPLGTIGSFEDVPTVPVCRSLSKELRVAGKGRVSQM